ncbi:MAG: c-type cytochrome [Pseudomonadota bacterium]
MTIPSYLIAAMIALGSVQSWAASPSYEIDGRHFDAVNEPTYSIGPDGTVDWYTAEGYAAYHRSCQGCHGPRGEGSPLGAGLLDGLRTQTYLDFLDAVTNGRIAHRDGTARIMPAFGTVPDVFCRIDAIFIYLRAEAADALPDTSPLASANAGTTAAEDLATCLAE